MSSGTDFKRETGVKFDGEKPDYSLLSAHSLEEIAKVMTYGKRKYSAHNWRIGISNSRLFSAAMRHLWAWMRGEDFDSETKLSHLAHAGCCVMMLLENIQLRPELDDRWEPGVKNETDRR